MGEGRTDEPQANHERLTVAQAAAALGITEGAVRSRIKRGTGHQERGRNRLRAVGRWFASDVPSPNTGVPGDQSALIASLQDQVRYLREQLDAEREARTEERRRHDTVLAQLSAANVEQAHTIRELEAPQEATEDAETVEEAPEVAEPRPASSGPHEGAGRRLWRRMFGR